MGPGLLVFTALFVLASLALMILAELHEDHWLVRTGTAGWSILGTALVVWWVTTGVVKFIKRRQQERREHAQRAAGLSGSSDQR